MEILIDTRVRFDPELTGYPVPSFIEDDVPGCYMVDRYAAIDDGYTAREIVDEAMSVIAEADQEHMNAEKSPQYTHITFADEDTIEKAYIEISEWFVENHKYINI